MLRAEKSSALFVLLLANSWGMWSFIITSFRLTLIDYCVKNMGMGLAHRAAVTDGRIGV